MVRNWLGQALFQQVHRRNLVYNCCWEDPQLDRESLELSSRDNVMVITSAGCNALDYMLAGVSSVHAVDVNPIQNALLELKVACAKQLNFDEFFQVFGLGRCEKFSDLYQSRIRAALPDFAQQVWDRRQHWLNGQTRRGSFYFCGSSGYFAYLINIYIDRVAKIRGQISEVLQADSVEQQQLLFEKYQIREKIFRPVIKWAIKRDATLSMLGVPRAQRAQIDASYRGGICQFVIDRVEQVFTQLPVANNYFWRVYLTGQYTQDCCPEYLREANFEQLKSTIDRVTTHTMTVTDFLRTQHESISRFVLLDHMDWLAANHRDALQAEWQQIVYAATPDARIQWRTAGLGCDFVDPIEVQIEGQSCRVGDLLRYRVELADSLHQRDRVNTYGRLFIADLASMSA